jgi:nitrate reductase gamma subunit
MTFEWFMVLFGWLAVFLFVGVSAYRIGRLARLPLNLRWEVYPVPHEAKEKRGYGGSYMEGVDWVSSPRGAAHLPAYLEMVTEILTLRKVKKHNTYHIWPLSLAMHWGIYLYFGWLALLVIDNSIDWTVLVNLTTVVGLGAFTLGAVGSLALVLRRKADQELALYTTPIDYMNLLFLASFFVASLVSWFGDFSFTAHQAYVGGVLFLRPAPVPPAVSVAFLLFELFLVYMPFSKLIHFFAKYLTFDLTLWDDEYKTKGSPTDKKVIEQLGYPVRWSASHIASGKSWLEQTQDTCIPEGKK